VLEILRPKQHGFQRNVRTPALFENPDNLLLLIPHDVRVKNSEQSGFPARYPSKSLGKEVTALRVERVNRPGESHVRLQQTHQSATRQVLRGEEVPEHCDALAGERELEDHLAVIRVERPRDLHRRLPAVAPFEIERRRATFAQVTEARVARELGRPVGRAVPANVSGGRAKDSTALAEPSRDERRVAPWADAHENVEPFGDGIDEFVAQEPGLGDVVSRSGNLRLRSRTRCPQSCAALTF